DEDPVQRSYHRTEPEWCSRRSWRETYDYWWTMSYVDGRIADTFRLGHAEPPRLAFHPPLRTPR
ncbi:MAG TPA: hypothetical protein VEW03_08220, partial [Longimicrobiaceae bacterium]|nr:hypothetical protein [Longimicrobiaceae bacterium]